MEENNELKDKKSYLLENENKDELEESELEEVLDSVPPEHRKIIERLMISSSIQMRSVSSPETVVMKKLTPDHITKYLDGAEQEMKNSYAERFHRKVFVLLSMVVSMVFFIVIIMLLKDNPDIMEKVIYTVGGVVIGAFGGYGFGKNRNED